MSGALEGFKVGDSYTDLQRDLTREIMAEYRGRIAWRDSLMTWPSVKVVLQLGPWHWRLGLYRDELEPYGQLDLGPITVDWGWNRHRPFALERHELAP